MTTNLSMTAGRRTKQGRSEVTRDQIIQAAFECIRDLGYARTTMELVAVRAGCTRGGVIYHFGSNKASLTLTVATMLSDRLLEIDLTDVPVAGRRSERLAAALHKAAQIYSGDEALVLLDIWIGCRTDDAMREQLARLVAAMNDRVVERWLAATQLEALAPEENAYRTLFRAAMRGLMVERILHGAQPIQDEAAAMLIGLGQKVSLDTDRA